MEGKWRRLGWNEMGNTLRESTAHPAAPLCFPATAMGPYKPKSPEQKSQGKLLRARAGKVNAEQGGGGGQRSCGLRLVGVGGHLHLQLLHKKLFPSSRTDTLPRMSTEPRLT